MLHSLRALILFSFYMTLVACISVQLPKEKVAKNSEVIARPPLAPFNEIKAEMADKIWLSSTTGNTISYLSECSTQEEKSIDQFQRDVLSVLQNPKTESSERIKFQGREATKSLTHGIVDGYPVSVWTVIFSKSNCSYSFSYVGLSSRLNQEVSVFESFLQNVRVP